MSDPVPAIAEAGATRLRPILMTSATIVFAMIPLALKLESGSETRTPIAVVLIWIDLLSRSDIGTGAKLAWAIFAIIPVVPFVYVLTSGDLW